MARVDRLSAVQVRNLREGRHADGDGLYLLVKGPEAAYWVLRYVHGGRMREMGLGPARGRRAVKLAEAREKAAALFRMHRHGIDPLEARAAEAAARKQAAQAAAAAAITFRQCAEFHLAAHEGAWRNVKHRAQWRSTLDTYAMPLFGDLPVASIGTSQVVQVLEPIWRTKPETASRLRGRIEAVLDYARTREWRSGENPARWRGHLANVLPARGKIAPVEHHAALPWREIGDFMAALAEQPGVAALALGFAILTAARTGEVIGARWNEVDLASATWTIPAARMKARREHRVPLSAPALAILDQVRVLRAGDDAAGPVFPGAQARRGLSNMALTMVLRRMKRDDLTVHGFRSTFRDWAGEATRHPREVAEAALAHVVGDKTEAAYLRADFLAKRRRLMDDWAAFCSRPSHKGDATVTTLRRGEAP